MVHGTSCYLLALLVLVTIASAGCVAADSPDKTSKIAQTGSLFSTPETMELLGQMQGLLREGTNGVFSYILSGNLGYKTTFYSSMDRVEVLDTEIRVIIDSRPEIDRWKLLEEYGRIDEQRRRLFASALLVLEEYDTGGFASESTLRTFNDDVTLMDSAFGQSASAAGTFQTSESTYVREFTIVNLMTMQEELVGSIGESSEYISPGSTE